MLHPRWYWHRPMSRISRSEPICHLLLWSLPPNDVTTGIRKDHALLHEPACGPTVTIHQHSCSGSMTALLRTGKWAAPWSLGPYTWIIRIHSTDWWHMTAPVLRWFFIAWINEFVLNSMVYLDAMVLWFCRSLSRPLLMRIWLTFGLISLIFGPKIDQSPGLIAVMFTSELIRAHEPWRRAEATWVGYVGWAWFQTLPKRIWQCHASPSSGKRSSSS
jgi:hypothetical protein